MTAADAANSAKAPTAGPIATPRPAMGAHGVRAPATTAVAMTAPAAVPTWMQWLQLPVTAAVVTGIVALLAVYLNRMLQSDRIKADMQIAERRLELDAELTERKLEADLKLAERKFELDRELDDWRRKVAFAEEALADIYRAETAISTIRSPAVWGHEYENRVGRETETPTVQRRRDQYFPYLDRIHQHGAFLDALHARRFRAIALFGRGADAPFNRVRAAVVQVQVGAQMLLSEQDGFETEHSRQHREAMLRRIWEGYVEEGQPDAIREEVAGIVAEAEQLFRPVLSRLPMQPAEAEQG